RRPWLSGALAARLAAFECATGGRQTAQSPLLRPHTVDARQHLAQARAARKGPLVDNDRMHLFYVILVAAPFAAILIIVANYHGVKEFAIDLSRGVRFAYRRRPRWLGGKGDPAPALAAAASAAELSVDVPRAAATPVTVPSVEASTPIAPLAEP